MQVLGIAAAQQNDGNVIFWAIMMDSRLHANTQKNPGRDWNGWTGPWNQAPLLQTLAASQQGGTRGAQLWAIDTNGVLCSSYQESAGGQDWSPWIPNWCNPPASFRALAAAQQNNGCVEVWAVDADSRLYSIVQQTPGGNWGKWSGSNWQNGPFLTAIAACQQGGSRGASFWGADASGTLWCTYQLSPGGTWAPWVGDWASQPASASFVALAAAQQNNGCVQLWAIDNSNQLYSISQKSPGGGWGAWSAAGWNQAPAVKAVAASQQGGARGAQLWAIDTNDRLVSCYQNSPGGTWSAWSQEGWAMNTLDFNMQAQQQNNWCWAAVTASVSLFYDWGSAWSQCELANQVLGQVDCCANGNSAACDQEADPRQALQITGNFTDSVDRAATAQGVLNRIRQFEPLVAVIVWLGGGSHAVAITGIDQQLNVTVQDPFVGTSIVPYNTLVNQFSYLGNGRWMLTAFTQI